MCWEYLLFACLFSTFTRCPVYGQNTSSVSQVCSTQCPSNQRCLQDNVTVTWGYVNGENYLCKSYKRCYDSSSYVEKTPTSTFFPVRLHPVDIARGSSVYFVSRGYGSTQFLFRIYNVKKGYFFNCSTMGGVAVSDGLMLSLKVPSHFLSDLGYKFFIAAGNPIYNCHFGLRLHMNIKDATNCTGHSTIPAGGSLCSGKGRCLSPSFTAGIWCECCHGYSGRYCEEYDACTSNPCQQGNCTDIKAGHHGDFHCTCPKGYIGQTCNIDIDDCDPKPCQNGGLCKDGLNSYTCLCPAEVHGKHCEKFSNLCEKLEPCQNGGTCVRVGISKQSYICNCPAGLSGQNCTSNATSSLIDSIFSLSTTPLIILPSVFSSSVNKFSLTVQFFSSVPLTSEPEIMSTTNLIQSINPTLDQTVLATFSVKKSNLISQTHTSEQNTISPQFSTFTDKGSETRQISVNQDSVVNTVDKPVQTTTQSFNPSVFQTVKETVKNSFIVTSLKSLMIGSSIATYPPSVKNSESGLDSTISRSVETTVVLSPTTVKREKTIASVKLPLSPGTMVTLSGLLTPVLSTSLGSSIVATQIPFSSRKISYVSPTVTIVIAPPSSVIPTSIPPLKNQTCAHQPCGEHGICTKVATGLNTELSFSCDCMYPTVGPVCTSDIELHFPFFNGNSYVKHKPIIFSSSINQFIISFHTETDGTILYSGHSSYRDFVKLEVVGQKLRFSVDAGDGAISITSLEFVTRNTTAAILIYNTQAGRVSMKVNNGSTLTSTTKRTLRSVQLYQPLFVGGIIPGVFTKDKPDIGDIIPFVGCIRELEFNDRAILLEDAVDWQNISECDLPACKALPCKNGGVCVSDIVEVNEYSCQCPYPYSGKNCEKQFACLVNICNGGTCLNTTQGEQCLCPFGKGGVSCNRDLIIDVPSFTVTNDYSSFLQYKTPNGLVGQLDIRLEIKLQDHVKANHSALIFYVGLHDHLSVGSDGDYLALGILNNHLLLQFNLGSGPVNIYSKHEMNSLQEWFVVLAGRKGKEGYLYIDNDDMQEASSPGPLVGLNVFGHLFLGGVPDFSQLNSEVVFKEGFRGTIKDPKVRTGSSNLWLPMTMKHSSNITTDLTVVMGLNVQNERVNACVVGACLNNGSCESLGASYVCRCLPTWSGMVCNDTAIPCREYNPCQGRSTCRMRDFGLTCDCPPGKAGVYCQNNINITMPHFQEYSYMSFSLEELNVQTETSISVGFSPSKGDGILFYITRDIRSHSGDFLSITLHDMFIYVIFNLGTGIAKCRSLNTVHVNRTNDVIITRDTKVASLVLNGNRTTCQSQGAAVKLNVESVFYVGGVPDLAQVQPMAYENTKDLRDFTGCIFQLMINQHSFDLTEHGALNGRNILNCNYSSRS